jgi:hypothetical protein
MAINQNSEKEVPVGVAKKLNQRYVAKQFGREYL